jgi:hypothetical protein
VLTAALGDYIAQIVIHCILGGAQDVGIGIRFCKNQCNVGAGGNGVRPQNIQ